MTEPMETRPAVDWMHVLERIEETLQQSLALVADPPSAVPVDPEQAAGSLRQLDERLERCQACLDRAERHAAEADAALAAEIQAVESWLASLQEAKEKVARCLALPGGKE